MSPDDIPDELKDDLREIGSIIFNSLSRDAVAKGLLDLNGLSPKEARHKALEYCKGLAESGNNFTHFVMDHKNTLLDEARNFLASDQVELAIVLFGTWWEHWLNSIIECRTIKQGLTYDDFQEIVRGTNNRAKSGWLLKLLDLPAFDESHLKVMNTLTEKRNQFIHYKYPAFLWEEDGLVPKDFFILLDISIAYFNKYEEQHIYLSFPALKT